LSKTTVAADRPSGRWIWVAFFLLVVLPLYAIATAVFIRARLFSFNNEALNNDQLKAVWTFLAAGLAAGATVLGALLTKSHNDRTLAVQDENEQRNHVLESDSNERLKLDIVVSTLNLICHDGRYSPKAVTAGGLATLVHLGHPIVAMRVLGPAFEDNAVDPSTLTWLINQVLMAKEPMGTPEDLEDAKGEAAALLRKYASTDLTNNLIGGRFRWPDAATAEWPVGLPQNAAANLIAGLVELLLSQCKEWWNTGGNTYTWIIYTLDEVVLSESAAGIKTMAATLGKALLEVTDEDTIYSMNDWRTKSEVAEHMASASVNFADLFDRNLYERIQAWGHGTSAPGIPTSITWPVTSP
jgi:hypothetical protein